MAAMVTAVLGPKAMLTRPAHWTINARCHSVQATKIAVDRLAPTYSVLPARPFLPGPLRPLQRRAQLAAPAATAAASPPASSSGDSNGGLLSSLANALTNLFPIWVLGCALWALKQPAAFSWFSADAITPALAVTMLGMGLTLTFEDFKRVLSQPGRIFAGFALQYTIMPLMALAVSRLAGLPLDYAVGLCIVGSCPGGTASNVVTYLAKADVTLSVAMTTASTLGAVVATPLLTQALLGTLVPVDALGLLVSTLQVVLLPVVVGAAINSAFPRAVERLGSVFSLTAVVLIALICGSVVGAHHQAVAAAGPRLLAAVAALHAGGFFFGYALSKMMGVPERAARTNSIEVGMQNSALGAMLAQAHFPAHPLAAVPCAISACTHSLMGSLLAAVWRGQPTGEAGEATVDMDDAAKAAGLGDLSQVGAAAATASGVLVQAQAAAGQQLAAAKAAMVSTAGAAARKAEVQAWIAAWRQRTGSGGSGGSSDDVPANVAEARAWIHRWRCGAAVPAAAASAAAPTSASSSAASADKAAVQAWIAAHRARSSGSAAAATASSGGAAAGSELSPGQRAAGITQQLSVDDMSSFLGSLDTY